MQMHAQDRRGVVAGTVKDASGAVLSGALVELQPTGKRAVSDAQGKYRIADVSTGDYSVLCSYVGFRAANADINVAGDRVETVNPVLEVAVQGDTVMVTGERLRGEAEAINIQRTSNDIVQVLPSKVINSLPNTNIADAVGRLPSVTLERDEGEGKYVQIRGTEPRLSNTTIDGVNVPSPEGSVRNVKLDVIPAALVDRIEVFKTLSANQDGDAIGGSVNLVTKTATERPTYEFGIQGGYSPIQNGRWLNGFDGTYGNRFGTEKKLGFLLGATYDHNDRGIDDFEPLPLVIPGADGTTPIAAFTTADLRTYRYYRTRYGFAGGTDYVVRPGTQVYMKGLFSDFHDYGDAWVYTPTSWVKGTSTSPGTAVTGQSGTVTTFDNTGNYKYRQYVRRPDQQIFSVLTGLDQTWNSAHLAVEFAGGRSHNIGAQDFATTTFNGPTGLQFSVDAKDPYRPQFNVQTPNVNVLDPKLYSMSSVVLPKAHSTQLNFQGGAALSKLYNIGSHFGTFEFGTKIRNANKTQNQDDQNFVPQLDGSGNNVLTPLLSDGLSTQTNPNYYDGSYAFGPLSDYTKLQNLFQNNPGSFMADTSTAMINSLGATYTANERIYAGYVMNTITVSKFRFETGLRIEATDAHYTANQVNLNNGNFDSVTPVTGSSGYINLLPSVQVQYQIEPNTNLRASYGRGLSRPNFQDIVPSNQTDPNTTPPSIVKGNPALVATTANDFDILAEHFFKGLGVVQGGFFYKKLANPIYNTSTTIQGGPQDGYQVKQSVNGPSAYIAGVELAYQQRLSFLPGMLNGFGVDGNYSYTTSQVTFPVAFGRTDKAALLRQAPNTYNVGMTYDRTRFSMRFGLSHNDANIYSYAYGGGDAVANKDPIIGLKGPGGDQYLYAHTQYDIQGSYRVARHLRVVVSGLNLSNEVFGFYVGSPVYPIQREYYKPSLLFGFRWDSSGSE
ncbi:MAG: TonB-dependent receptor [Acidobacteriota bacterium]|nr:TonB-dependent receptor [Acidobacteriota bacterium]